MKRRTFLTLPVLPALARVSSAFTAAAPVEAPGTRLTIREDERVHEHVFPRPPIAAAISRGPHDWLTTFDDVSRWTITADGIADPVVRRCTYRPLFEDHHVEFAWTKAAGRFRLIPPKPLTFPDVWDTIGLWLGGDGAAAVTVTLECDSTDGRTKALTLQQTPRELDLAERYVTEAERRGLERGGKVRAAEVRIASDKPGTLRLYAATAFDAKRFRHYARPTPLPFPTHPDGIVPTPTIAGTATVSHVDLRSEFVFQSKEGGDLRYTVEPKTGTLADVRVAVNGSAPFRPCVVGGLVFEVNGKTVSPANAAESTRLVSRQTTADRLVTHWETHVGGEAVRYRITYRIVRRSLVIEAYAVGSAAVELRIGYPDAPGAHREIQIPMLTWFGGGPAGSEYPADPMPSRGGQGRLVASPGVLLAGDVFLTAILDWYVSDASFPYAVSHTSADAGFDGGAFYVPVPDRGRNPLREKLILTASTDVQDVLPNIPNPPSKRRDAMRDRVYRHGDEPTVSIKRHRNLGITAVATLMQSDLAGYEGKLDRGVMDDWIDHPSDVDRRWTDQPKRAGESGFAAFLRQVRALQDLGWLIGTYTISVATDVPFACFAEIPKVFTPDGTPRQQPDGTWVPATGEVIPYMTRQMRKIEDKCAFGLMYDDVRTQLPIWTFTDFHPAAPDAGKFRATFEQTAQLYQARGDIVGGPVLSEGGMHWIFAGLIDGNLARTYGSYNVGNVMPIPPDIVDFHLRRIHPLNADIGGNNYFQQWGAEYRDRNMCQTLAYAKIGFWSPASPPHETQAMSCRTYYTFHLAQQRYRDAEVVEIRYHEGDRLVDASEIIRQGKERTGRIYTRFNNGFESWTNLNPEKPWAIRVDDREWELPPYGWYQRRKEDWGTFTNASVNLGGQHCWRVAERDMLMAGAPAGTRYRFDDVEADGTVIVRRDSAGKRCVINVDAKELRLAARLVDATAKFTFRHLDGALVGDTAASTKDGWTTFTTLPADHLAVEA